MTKQTIKRGAAPAREVFGPAFDAIPKAVFAAVAYDLARTLVGDGGDAEAKRVILDTWGRLAPAGLPLPGAGDKAALVGATAGT